MCGLFGFSRYGTNHIPKLASLTNALAVESSVRGTDATGIAVCNNGKISVTKDSKPAYKMEFKHNDDILTLTGHTRHSTQGSEKRNYNNHPFIGKTDSSSFALSHNGVLMNDEELRKKLSLPKIKIETDSYIAVQLIESKKALSCETIKYMAETIKGSFSFSILDDRNNIYLVKGDSPLSILHFPLQKIYVYASTDNILYKALIDSPLFKDLKKGEFEELSIDEGEILTIEQKLNNSQVSENTVIIDTDLILSQYREFKESPLLPSYRDFIANFIDKISVGKYRVEITLKTGLDIYPDLDTSYTVRRQEIYDRKCAG